MKWTLALPGGGLVAVSVAGGLLALGVGFWLGAQLQAGSAAIEQRDELQRQVGELRVAADALRQRALLGMQDYREAHAQLADAAEGLTHDLAKLEATALRQQQRMAQLLAAHPEWRDCRIGADGVHAWNAAAAGANPATDAAAGVGGSAARAVSGNAAGAVGRPLAGAVEQLPGSGTGIPPLPLQDGAPDPGAGDP